MGETGVVKREVVDIQALISQGLEKGAGIDVMERMFAMAKEADAIRAKRAFFEALAKFQSEMPIIKKEKEVKNSVAKGGGHRYNYAPLEAIVEQVKEPLKNNGFSYTLKTEQPDGFVIVICEAHHEAGHTELTQVKVPVGSDYMTVQQVIGAAITYAKRYAFCNAFGIMTGDEDTDAVDTPANDKPVDAPAKAVEETAAQKEFKLLFAEFTSLMKDATQGQDEEGKRVAYESTFKKLFPNEKKAPKFAYLTEIHLKAFIDTLKQGKN